MKHRFLRLLIFLLPVIALLGAVVPMATPAQAAVGTIIYVNQGVTGGSHNGDSWADAYTDLQSALSDAVSGDQIWVAAGTYKPTNLRNESDPRSATFSGSLFRSWR